MQGTIVYETWDTYDQYDRYRTAKPHRKVDKIFLDLEKAKKYIDKQNKNSRESRYELGETVAIDG